MEVKREQNVLMLNKQQEDLEATLVKLASKDSSKIAQFFAENGTVPREVRTLALRLVLNDYVMIGKELKLSDEVKYRLNWYDKFSETQLIKFWQNLENDNADKFNAKSEMVRFKKTFFLLLMINASKLDLEDEAFVNLLNLPSDKNETFNEFMKEIDGAFYDYDFTIDGMSYEDFKANLKKSSTVQDIREIADKFGVELPKRLKKEEFVQVVCDGLRRQGKYSEEQEAKLNKMSATLLQRFAKDNGIAAATEMKKDDLIDYIMNHIEAASKAEHKPRIELESLPELEAFQFKKDYLQDNPKTEEAPEEEKALENTPEMPAAPQAEESPVVENEPAKPLEEEKAEPEEIVQEEPVKEALEEAQEEQTEKEPETEIVSEPASEPVSETNESKVDQETLDKIVKLLEERDEKDAATVKMYEERIAFLERIIEAVINKDAAPINVQVNSTPAQPASDKPEVCNDYVTALPLDEEVQPQQPQQPIVVVVGGEKKDESPNEEFVRPIPVDENNQPEEVYVLAVPLAEEEKALELAPEVASEEEKVVNEDELQPLVCETTFAGLDKNAKELTAKELMEDSNRIADKNKVSSKHKRKLTKLEKEQQKIEKMRSANEKEIYKRSKRRKAWKVFWTIFWTIVLIFLAISVYCLLCDISPSIIPSSVSDVTDKYLWYTYIFEKGGALRELFLSWYNGAYNFFAGLFNK